MPSSPASRSARNRCGELAEGKKTVAISFDDLTRTTPAYAVTPWLVSELAKAGIKDENILFIGSFGTHRAMTQEEVGRKARAARSPGSYAWLNHDVFDNVKEVGTTTRGNKILLNQTFLGADLKICISGIKVHQDAGYGGGAKAILPGLAALPTVEYNHTQILTKVRTTGPVKIFKNDMRLDMIEAARMANVDYTFQILYNDRLRPTRIWARRHRGRAPCRRARGGQDVLHAHSQGRRYRGGQRLSAERPGVPRRTVDQLLGPRRRHRSADRPASAGPRPGSLPEQPPGWTQPAPPSST